MAVQDWYVQFTLRFVISITKKKTIMSKTNSTEILSTTPVFPSSVYDNLPPFIKQMTDQFSDPREKDVVLISILVVLSGCFNKIEGVYSKDWVFANLYAFIVAPPASGKGVMKYAQILGKMIQELFLKANDEAKRKFDAEVSIWKNEVKKDAGTAGIPPKKPKYPLLFIPGNTSSTAIYKRLFENDGIGIICETEADTLSGAISQDWGSFSDLMRKGFHHEPLSISRSGDDLLLYIERPRPSVLLTGTPDQVPRLIGSVHDGLCSRFLFYCYSRDLKWIDPTPCNNCPDLGAYFEGQSETVASIDKLLASGSFSFKLTEEQFKELSENFRKKLHSIKLFEGSEAGSAVIRLGIIAFRIAMILTVISQKDNLKNGRELICSDTDLKTSLSITDVCFQHAMVMYSLLPKHSKNDLKSQLRQFYLLLPVGEKFARKNANETGIGIGISERTVGNYLEKLVEKGFLTNPEYGSYLKNEGE
jgi:hypothetical protein